MPTNDNVNHPSHYGGDTVYETIKVLHAWDLNFNLGNAVKYISRAGKKNDYIEDLKKARFYLDYEIQHHGQTAEATSNVAEPSKLSQDQTSNGEANTTSELAELEARLFQVSIELIDQLKDPLYTELRKDVDSLNAKVNTNINDLIRLALEKYERLAQQVQDRLAVINNKWERLESYYKELDRKFLQCTYVDNEGTKCDLYGFEHADANHKLKETRVEDVKPKPSTCLFETNRCSVHERGLISMTRFDAYRAGGEIPKCDKA